MSEKTREQHKQEMGEKYAVLNHPKFDRAYDLAWEHGHSSGFDEVEFYFAGLVELIK